jgi:hypothetical protein
LRIHLIFKNKSYILSKAKKFRRGIMMKRFNKWILWACLAASSSIAAAPVLAQDAPAVMGREIKPEIPVSAKAMELAQLLHSEETIIGSDIPSKNAEKLEVELLKSTGAYAEQEKKYPGLLAEIIRTAYPIVNRFDRKRLPELQKRQAQLYDQHLNQAELSTVTKFYASPTGQKMIEQMHLNIEGDAMIAEAKKSEDLNFSTEAVLSDIEATVPKMLRAFSAEDTRALIEFSQTSAFNKVKAMGPETQSIGLEWRNESNPEAEKQVALAIAALIEKREAGQVASDK